MSKQVHKCTCGQVGNADPLRYTLLNILKDLYVPCGLDCSGNVFGICIYDFQFSIQKVGSFAWFLLDVKSGPDFAVMLVSDGI